MHCYHESVLSVDRRTPLLGAGAPGGRRPAGDASIDTSAAAPAMPADPGVALDAPGVDAAPVTYLSGSLRFPARDGLPLFRPERLERALLAPGRLPTASSSAMSSGFISSRVGFRRSILNVAAYHLNMRHANPLPTQATRSHTSAART